MKKFYIERHKGDIIIGEKVRTRGNDEEFPTFILEDGTRFGCHKSRIIGEVEENGEKTQ